MMLSSGKIAWQGSCVAQFTTVRKESLGNSIDAALRPWFDVKYYPADWRK